MYFKSILLSLSLGLNLSISLPSFGDDTPASYQAIDKVAAIVGEDVIFFSEVQKQLQQSKVRLQARGRTANEELLKERVLDDLINIRLQMNLAKKNNVQVTEKEVDKAIAETKVNLQRNNIPFDKYLAAQGLSEHRARQQLKTELTIKKVQEAVIKQRVTVTQREIDNFLDSKAGQEWGTPRFHLGHILITDKTSISAQKLYQQLKKDPKSFARYAAKYSQGRNAKQGGDLGMKKQNELPALFISEAKKLAIGGISQPFKSPAGTHIIMLVNKQGIEPIIVEQHKVKHILIKVTELFTDEEAKAKIDAIFQRLNAGEDFADIAKANSEDLGSKANGGSLGWSTPGKFVPVFEKTMNSIPLGEVSAPFKSQFGWHVLAVDERRTQDMQEAVKRNQVVNLLRQQRFDDELRIWLQELRDNTYVEIRI